MYRKYFGLGEAPFSIAPDPRYLYMSERHQEALAHLLYGISGDGGFVLLTGEVGAGKTTICRCLLEQIPPNCDIAYIFNPKLTVEELLSTICTEFGVAYPAGRTTVKTFVDNINAYLLDAHARGRQAVLIIDEAQSLSVDVLEQMRLLTNLETNQRKLLQIILVGQPELAEMLARPSCDSSRSASLHAITSDRWRSRKSPPMCGTAWKLPARSNRYSRHRSPAGYSALARACPASSMCCATGPCSALTCKAGSGSTGRR